MAGQPLLTLTPSSGGCPWHRVVFTEVVVAGSQLTAQRLGAGAGGSASIFTTVERSAAAASGAVLAGGCVNARSGPSSCAAAVSVISLGVAQP